MLVYAVGMGVRAHIVNASAPVQEAFPAAKTTRPKDSRLRQTMTCASRLHAASL
jgi:hypothetical protein